MWWRFTASSLMPRVDFSVDCFSAGLVLTRAEGPELRGERLRSLSIRPRETAFRRQRSRP